MSNTNETTKKEIKQAWSKIINKNKDNVIIVPPHRTDQKIDPITLSWDEFNENFVFDEKDKTHCYTKPDSKYAEIFKKFKKPKKNDENKTLEKDIKNAIKSAEPVLDKAKKEIDQAQKKEKVVSKVKKEVTTNKKPPRKRQTVNNSSNYEYTMSIGEMIKNSGKLL